MLQCSRSNTDAFVMRLICNMAAVTTNMHSAVLVLNYCCMCYYYVLKMERMGEKKNLGVGLGVISVSRARQQLKARL